MIKRVDNNDGTYTVIAFYDLDDKEVDEEVAYKTKFAVFDKGNKMIREGMGFTDNYINKLIQERPNEEAAIRRAFNRPKK
ncbi:MAG: hypothetical protein IJH20_04725 [Bacilli bacterium]|nr:hypothetical protein [Bacilli bacterium]